VYLFIYLPILEREKVSKKTVHYIWCFGPCGLKLEAGMGKNQKSSWKSEIEIQLYLA
jgi:hypothetical protein